MPKDTRIDLRVETKQKQLLSYAAKTKGLKLSTFVLDSALKEAEVLLTEQTHFALPARQWQAFCAALDRPAKDIPALKRLLAERTRFEE
jgi:uncharacterized protein (DUF1778 family)